MLLACSLLKLTTFRIILQELVTSSKSTLNRTTADIQSTGAASSGAPSSLEGDFGNITIAYYKDVLCVLNKFKMENIILTKQDHVELLNVGAIPAVRWTSNRLVRLVQE